MKTYSQPVFISVSDLNYEGRTTAVMMERKDFYRMKRFDGRYLKERCSEARYNKIKRDEAHEQYSLEIQKKYNVGPNWKNNRWFVEQVRPTLS